MRKTIHAPRRHLQYSNLDGWPRADSGHSREAMVLREQSESIDGNAIRAMSTNGLFYDSVLRSLDKTQRLDKACLSFLQAKFTKRRWSPLYSVE